MLGYNCPYSRSYFSTPSFNCTYGSASNQTSNAQYAIGGAIGMAFTEIGNANWNAAKDYGLSSGNHWVLPNGTHMLGDTKIIKSDSCIRYEPEHGLCSGVTKDGIPYSYIK